MSDSPFRMRSISGTQIQVQAFYDYCKNQKNSDTRKFAVITWKFEQGCFTIT